MHDQRTKVSSPRPSSTAVVVPCFNELERLDPARFSAAGRACGTVDFIFVDDGSTDGTDGMLRVLCEAHPGRMQCIRLERNRGKAEAVRTGVRHALAEGYALVGYWDADLATPLSTIPRLVERFADDRVQMVLCSRVKILGHRIERNALRHYVGRILATLVSVMLGLPVYDTQCGAKLFRATDALGMIFERPFSGRWVFDVEILGRMIVLESAGRVPAGTVATGIVEYPVEEWNDIAGSKIRLKDFLLAPFDLLRVYFALQRLKRTYEREGSVA